MKEQTLTYADKTFKVQVAEKNCEELMWPQLAIQTYHVQCTRLLSWTDKHYSLVSGDDFRSDCQKVSHQQLFSELPLPGRSHYTNLKHNRCQEYSQDASTNSKHPSSVRYCVKNCYFCQQLSETGPVEEVAGSFSYCSLSNRCWTTSILSKLPLLQKHGCMHDPGQISLACLAYL